MRNFFLKRLSCQIILSFSVSSLSPGRSVVSAGGDRAGSRALRLPRLQRRGKREPRGEAGDQRSAFAASLSLCLKTLWFTFLFLGLASDDTVVLKLKLKSSLFYFTLKASESLKNETGLISFVKSFCFNLSFFYAVMTGCQENVKMSQFWGQKHEEYANMNLCIIGLHRHSSA